MKKLVEAFGARWRADSRLHPEFPLPEASVRPDYAVESGGRVTGFLELKAPGHDITPDGFTKRDREQWELMRQLPNVLYTNGHTWCLYRGGLLPLRTVRLEGDLYRSGSRLRTVDPDGASLRDLLRDFLGWQPERVTTVRRLVTSMAPLCQYLRAEVLEQLDIERRTPESAAARRRARKPFTALAHHWSKVLPPSTDGQHPDHIFADRYTQTIAFALLLARTEGLRLTGPDLAAVASELEVENTVMGRALQLLTERVDAEFARRLNTLVQVVDAVDWKSIGSSTSARKASGLRCGRASPGVQQQLMIAVFVRSGGGEKPAYIRYVALEGTGEQKYAQLEELAPDSARWRPVRSDAQVPFTPAAEGDWDAYPALGDLLPWAVPGVLPKRTCVYSTDNETLRARWWRLVAEKDIEEKRALFRETHSRAVDRPVLPLPGCPLPKLSMMDSASACPDPVPVAYRPFDRQWIIPDNRVLDRSSPELWESRIPDQIRIVEQHSKKFGPGPAVLFSALLPDRHHFDGRGGRVLSLLQKDGTPNVAPGLLQHLSNSYGYRNVSAEDLAAYIAAVTAHPDFTSRFQDELTTRGVRVPLSGGSELWSEALGIGRTVIWASTFGERFFDPKDGRPRVPIRFGEARCRRSRTGSRSADTSYLSDFSMIPTAWNCVSVAVSSGR